jgi:hypothetical protein
MRHTTQGNIQAGVRGGGGAAEVVRYTTKNFTNRILVLNMVFVKVREG